VLRAVTRWGSTEAEAGAPLRAALRERPCCGDGEVGASTRLVSAAPVWLDEIDRSDLAVSTRQLYRAAARLYRDRVRRAAVARAGAAGI
jgi:hypothetical protein